MICSPSALLRALTTFTAFALFMCGASIAWPQTDPKDFEAMQKRMEEVQRKIEACGSDVKCLERVGEEARRMLLDHPFQDIDPAGTDRQLTVTIHNRVEYRKMDPLDPCVGGSAPMYVTQAYTFDYTIQETGRLRSLGDGKSYTLQSPRASLYAYDRPSKLTIAKKSGYRQGIETSRWGKCSVKRYDDGALKEISSGNKTASLVISFNPKMGADANVYFGPIAITVTNPDRSCPSCSESLYEPTVIESKIPVAELNAAIAAGRLERTFEKRETLDDHGSYSRNTVTISIEIEGKPGRLAVSPADGLKSTVDSDGAPTPGHKTYTLKNTGETAIHFSVVETQPWVTLSNKSGSLAGGATAKVKVSIGDVSKLKAGQYKDQIVFKNTTSGQGSTSRPVTLEVEEYQVWDIKLTGMELDDMGGKMMYAKMNDAWRYVTVDYGVNFHYVMQTRVVVKKHKGKWEYVSGTIKSARVNTSSNFDPVTMASQAPVCRNCKKFATDLAGDRFGGSADGLSVKLLWPGQPVPEATVKNQLKLKHNSLDKSHQGYSVNVFYSAEFLDTARKHKIKLANGHFKPKPVVKRSHKHRSRLDKRPPISMSYEYYLKRVK